MPRVKNIDDTTYNACKCGNWLTHWENYSGKPASYCAEEKCIDENIVGAYVQMVNSSDKNWYIVPLCRTHYMSKAEFEVVGPLVSANRKETCEKLNRMIRTKLYFSRILPKRLLFIKV